MSVSRIFFLGWFRFFQRSCFLPGKTHLWFLEFCKPGEDFLEGLTISFLNGNLTSSLTPTTVMFNSPPHIDHLLLLGCSQYQNLFLRILLENYHSICCPDEREGDLWFLQFHIQFFNQSYCIEPCTSVVPGIGKS